MISLDAGYQGDAEDFQPERMYHQLEVYQVASISILLLLLL